MKAKITRLHKGKGLRTDTVEGETDTYPVVGRSFLLLGKGLDYGMRVVRTSPVQKIIRETEREDLTTDTGYETYIVTTETGSEYQVEIERAN